MSEMSKILCTECNRLNGMHVSKTPKILCTECNRLNGTHVEDVKDICMQCNTVYCTLNDMHVKDVEDDKNTHNVDF